MNLKYNDKTGKLIYTKTGECQLSGITSKMAKNLIVNMAGEYFKVIIPQPNMIHTYVDGMNLVFAGYLTPGDLDDIVEHLIAYYN